MKILRAIAFLLLMIVTTPLCFAQGGGGNVGNGGNGYEVEFRYLGAQIRHYIEVEGPLFYFNGAASIWDEVVEAIDHVPVRFTNFTQESAVKFFPCRSYPNRDPKKRLIECDSDAWNSIFVDQKPALVFRMYLEIAGDQSIDRNDMNRIVRLFGTATEGKINTRGLLSGDWMKLSDESGFGYLTQLVYDWINAGAPDLNVGAVSKTVDWRQVTEAMDHVPVEFTHRLLYIEGIERVCKNYPNQNLQKRRIVCNYEMWDELLAGQKAAVVFHEYLGITGYESNIGEYSQYPLSRQIVGMPWNLPGVPRATWGNSE